ncbi:MAG TPA: phage tail protein [Allosphingosinicella sp.]|nr:phage tail protein [Allosphingosinicella sp.]
MSEVPPPSSPADVADYPIVLWIPQLVATKGFFPAHGGQGPAHYTLGMVQSFAALFHAFNAPTASGQVLEILSNTALFSLYSNNFGGDGRNDFAYPALDGVTPVGGPPGQQGADTLGMTWLIASQSVPSVGPLAGTLALFGGSFVPGGWLAADGAMYPPSAFPELFGVIGSTFGGDGQSSFAVPNLTGAAPVGTGVGPAGQSIAMGEQVSGQTPGLGLDYLICTDGLFPTEDGDGDLTAGVFVGHIVPWAGGTIPQGWLACDGSQLPISSYMMLFKVIGTLYGGDGVQSFALPDLSGLMIQGRTI